MDMVERQGDVRQPETPLALRNVLDVTRIRIDAVILTSRARRGNEGVLVISRNGKRQSVAMSGGAAVALALAAERPVLIAESLAEKLYVRGKSGKPLSPRGAKRKLSSAG